MKLEIEIEPELFRRLRTNVTYFGDALNDYILEGIQSLVDGDESDIQDGRYDPPEWLQ